jgi:hypothetical protein
MSTRSPSNSYLFAALTSVTMVCSGIPAGAQDLPSYMAPISGQVQSSAADVVTKNMLALNAMMFELYGDAAQIFQKTS